MICVRPHVLSPPARLRTGDDEYKNTHEICTLPVNRKIFTPAELLRSAASVYNDQKNFTPEINPENSAGVITPVK